MKMCGVFAVFLSLAPTCLALHVGQPSPAVMSPAAAPAPATTNASENDMLGRAQRENCKEWCQKQFLDGTARGKQAPSPSAPAPAPASVLPPTPAIVVSFDLNSVNYNDLEEHVPGEEAEVPVTEYVDDSDKPDETMLPDSVGAPAPSGPGFFGNTLNGISSVGESIADAASAVSEATADTVDRYTGHVNNKIQEGSAAISGGVASGAMLTHGAVEVTGDTAQGAVSGTVSAIHEGVHGAGASLLQQEPVTETQIMVADIVEGTIRDILNESIQEGLAEPVPCSPVPRLDAVGAVPLGLQPFAPAAAPAFAPAFAPATAPASAPLSAPGSSPGASFLGVAAPAPASAGFAPAAAPGGFLAPAAAPVMAPVTSVAVFAPAPAAPSAITGTLANLNCTNGSMASIFGPVNLYMEFFPGELRPVAAQLVSDDAVSPVQPEERGPGEMILRHVDPPITNHLVGRTTHVQIVITDPTGMDRLNRIQTVLTEAHASGELQNHLGDALEKSIGIRPNISNFAFGEAYVPTWSVDNCTLHMSKIVKKFSMAYTPRMVPMAIFNECTNIMTALSFSRTGWPDMLDVHRCRMAAIDFAKQWNYGKGGVDPPPPPGLALLAQPSEFGGFCTQVCEHKYGAVAPQCKAR